MLKTITISFVKRIYLIETVRAGLKNVRAYLSDIDIEYSIYPSVDEALNSEQVGDLVILMARNKLSDFQADKDKLRNHPSYEKIPRIYILPFSVRDEVPDPNVIDGIPSFPIPVEKLRFLATVSEFLKRAQRRVFKIVVTIIPDGTNIRYLGTSIDFSQSGMAFESSAALEKGQFISVSFVNPKNRNRLLFKGEVIRRAGPLMGKSAFYGVQFARMTEPQQGELREFLTGVG